MSTHTLEALAIPKTNHQSKHGARARTGKTAITVLLSGAIFVGIGVTIWSMLQAEFERTFHEFSACTVVALERASLRAGDAHRVDA